MAASKRRLDEKHLKILRELGSQAQNKQCFDCHQRGPTYINMTCGSFVCTSCSGILRGLNPPHRVKSISMTSFTPEEIEFIRSKGNEYCRRVWLGTYDSRSIVEPESKDEQRIKDFMIQKYERKRWYVDPSMLPKSQIPSAPVVNSPTTPIPEVKPLTSLVNNAVKPLIVQSNQVGSVPNRTLATSISNPGLSSSQHNSMHRPSLDLLSEFAGDPFASAANSASQSANNANFANFENFNSSGTMSSPPSIGSTPISTASASSQFASFTSVAAIPSPGSAVPAIPVSGAGAANHQQPQQASINSMVPAQDKYAALADLDNMFNSSTNANTTTTSSEWEGKNNSATWPVNGTSGSKTYASTPNNVPSSGFINMESPNPFSPNTQQSWGQSQPPATAFPTGNPFTSGFSTQSNPNSYGQFSVVSPPPPSSTSPYAPAINGQFGGTQNGGYPATPPAPNNMMWPNTGVSGGWVNFNMAPQQQNPYSTSNTFPPNKQLPVGNTQFQIWQAPVGNPFMVNSTQTPPRSNSSNPFL